MNAANENDRALAIVCGSDTLAGGALVSRLRNEGWDIVTINPLGAPPHPAASVRLQGAVWEGAIWKELQRRIRDSGQQPRAFVHAASEFGPESLNAAYRDGAWALARIERGAELGCEHVMPLLAAHEGAVVYLASVLAEWDTRAGTASYAASQAGLRALARTLAVSDGSERVRVNTVAMGLVAKDPESVPAAVRQRIPLGRAASPEDIVDAVLFLLSADASHISGSTLVVDGGQSLQSWSNAPRDAPYPLASTDESARLASVPRFQNLVVLITGAAGGLGSAAAHRFAAEGARLALLDRDADAVERLAREFAAQGHDALPVAVDVTDDAAMAAAFAHAEEYFGRLDVIFNNAGVGSRDLNVVDTPVAQWDEVIAINLRGVFLGCKYGVPALARAGGGAIVNMGSSTGRHDTITGGAPYMASKAAVEALTKSLALQVAPSGIRANTIAPGIIQTELSFRQQERGDAESFFAEFAARIPSGRVGQPADVAAAVTFLASHQARHITGASLLIDGGQTRRRWISAPDIVGTYDQGVIA